MRTLVVAIVVITAGVGAAPRQAAAADLGEAKTLYANASYDEAIQELNGIHSAEDANQVDQYLALCLLALGRSGEAEQPLEQILAREPLYVMSQADTSPKLIDLFHQVRRRVLPVVAFHVYSQGRADYEAKRFSAAVGQFKQLIDISNDPESGDSVEALKQLGEGFLTLSQAALVQPVPAAVATPSTAPEATVNFPSVPPGSSRGDVDRIYTGTDAGVVAPRAINRQFPVWDPLDHSLARREFRGALAVVIDEYGAVESASFPAPTTTEYDTLLLAATRQWKFRPATKDGKPVKYLVILEVLLRPSEK